MVEKIKKLCASKGMSLNDLEEQIDGVGINTIYRWDTSAPNVLRLKAVADFFGVSVDYLLGNEIVQSDSESALVAKYRMLDDTQKDAVLTLIDAYLAKNPVKKESAM